MAASLERIKNYFTEQPLPQAAFQLSSSYLSGIHVSLKEKSLKSHFLLLLDRGIIEPSFSQKNLKDPAALEKKIKESLEKARWTERKVACLIPELSLKVFVFFFDSLPSSQKDREQIIRFRVKKQLPLLPQDARFSFGVSRSNGSWKVVAAVVRTSVIREYEEVFDRLNLKIRMAGVPSLSLNNLIKGEKGKDYLLINIEDDFFSLVGVVNSEVVLYRLKPFLVQDQSGLSLPQRVETIVKEAENTVNFIEDKEKAKVQSFCVRLGLWEHGEDMFSELEKELPFPVTEIEAQESPGLGWRERKILSPLLGQILR